MKIIQTWPETDILFLREVYRLQLASRMNSIYYENRLRAVMIWSFWLSVIIALTASGSGVGSLLNADSSTTLIHFAWKALAVTAAVAAVVRPIYAPSKRIERFTRQCRGYQANFNSLSKLLISIKTSGQVTKEHHHRFSTLIDRHGQLESSDDCGVNRRALLAAQQIALRELPDHALWWPPYVCSASFSDIGSRSKDDGNSASVLMLKP